MTYWDHVPSHTTTADDDYSVTMDIDKHHRIHNYEACTVLKYTIQTKKQHHGNISPCKRGQPESHLSPLLGA